MRSIRLLLIGALLLLLALPAAAPARPHHGHGHGHHAQPLVIGHRGASGYRPEHTLASYELADRAWAPTTSSPTSSRPRTACSSPATSTRSAARPTSPTTPSSPTAGRPRSIDGIARHRLVHRGLHAAPSSRRCARRSASRPSARRTRATTGSSRSRPSRRSSTCARGSRASCDRPIGIYPETKHPTYFRSIGLPLEPRARARAEPQRPQPPRRAGVRAVLRERQPARAGPVAEGAARAAARRHGAPTTCATAATRARTPSSRRPPACASIARYADGVGPSKNYIVPRDADGRPLAPTSFVRDAHAAGLLVHPYTFRRENQFLPLELRVGRPRPQRDRRPGGGDPAVLRARRRRRVHRQPRHRRRAARRR